MKCKACGYEHVYAMSKFVPETGKGDEEFTEVEGHFTVTSESSYGPDVTRRVHLLACPKCKTVVLDDSY